MFYITRTLLLYLLKLLQHPPAEGTAPSILQGQELLQRNGCHCPGPGSTGSTPGRKSGSDSHLVLLGKME